MERRGRGDKIRLLVAKPGIDSHWAGAALLATSLRNAGMEAIYTGLYQSPEMIVTAALQEDVEGIALSMLAGQHLEVASEVMRLLRERGAGHICVFAGGIIPEGDKPLLESLGLTGNYGPNADVSLIVDHIRGRVLAARQP